MPAGRPTKYTPEIQKKADEYVQGGFLAEGDVVPSQAGLALILDLDRQTIHNWKSAHPEFFDTLERISYLQEKISLNGGLKGDLNSTIVKLLLANHGYSERQAVDLTSKGESLNPPKTLDDLYNEKRDSKSSA